jgi:hypothetical protein
MSDNIYYLMNINTTICGNSNSLYCVFCVQYVGSPFQFTVGPIAGGGPHKVRAIGPGLERGEANKPSE